MDQWEGLSTVFNHWNFCFKIIIHCWATVHFVTQDEPSFHEIFKIFVVINQKLCGVWGQKLVWVVSTIGTTNTPNFVKIREVTQNSLLIWHGMTHIFLFIWCYTTTRANQIMLVWRHSESEWNFIALFRELFRLIESLFGLIFTYCSNIV